MVSTTAYASFQSSLVRHAGALWGMLAIVLALAPLSAAAQQLTDGRQIDFPRNSVGNDGIPGDDAGRTVAVWNDTAVVGVPSDNVGNGSSEGSAYVYRRVGTEWQLVQKLVAEEGVGLDRFGWSVAISGNSIVVGAIEHDTEPYQDEGAAFVFVEQDGVWRQQQRLVKSDPVADERFGWAVAIDGDTIVVGTPISTVNGVSQGSALVFERAGATWTQRAMLDPVEPEANMGFGFSVAVSGPSIVVGAYLDSINGVIEQGSVTVYQKAGDTWAVQQTLIAPDGAQNDRFGRSVALSGDLVAIGASTDTINEQRPYQGSAYLFGRIGQGWSMRQKLIAPDGAIYDNFGHSVAIGGQRVVVGSPSEIGSAPGAAYVFAPVGASWFLESRLQRSSNQPDEQFGFSVAATDGWVLSGTPLQRSVRSPGMQGFAHSFSRQGSQWVQRPVLGGGLGSSHSLFGSSVALSADAAAVGAPFEPNATLRNDNCVVVFERDGAHWRAPQILEPPDTEFPSRFGESVAIGGDLLVVGSPLQRGGGFSRGAVHAYLRINGVWEFAGLIPSPEPANSDHFGAQVAVVGNHVLVTAPSQNLSPDGRPGAVFVFERTGSSFPFRQKLQSGDADGYSRFGSSMSVQGDTAAIGAMGERVVHVFERAGDVWQFRQKLMPDGPTFQDFGSTLAVSGDKIAVGHPSAVIPEDFFSRGNVDIFVKSGGTWTRQARLQAPPGTSQSFGLKVALTGQLLVIGDRVNRAGGEGVNVTDVLRTYRGAGSEWTLTGTIRSHPPQSGFAETLVVDPVSIVAGAPRSEQSDIYANENTGAVHVFPADVDKFIFRDSFE